MLPPGVPPEVVHAMRRAFDATVHDPLFKEEAVKIGVVIAHKTGEQIEELIMKAAATPKAIIDRANELGQRGKR